MTGMSWKIQDVHALWYHVSLAILFSILQLPRQDRAPLESVPPTVDKTLQESANKLFEGRVDKVEMPEDAYAAQLARGKASKIESAEKVLAIAVKKATKKAPTGRGRGKGRGRGRGKKSAQTSDAGDGAEDPAAMDVQAPGETEEADQEKAHVEEGDEPHDGKGDGKAGDSPDDAIRAQWLVKETAFI